MKDIPGIGAKTLFKADEILGCGKLKNEGFSVPKETNKTELSEQKNLEGYGRDRLKKNLMMDIPLKNCLIYSNTMKNRRCVIANIGIKYYKDL